jgi:hypothetical protein
MPRQLEKGIPDPHDLECRAHTSNAICHASYMRGTMNKVSFLAWVGSGGKVKIDSPGGGGGDDCPPPLQTITKKYQWQPFPSGNADTEVATAVRRKLLTSIVQSMKWAIQSILESW